MRPTRQSILSGILLMLVLVFVTTWTYASGGRNVQETLLPPGFGNGISSCDETHVDCGGVVDYADNTCDAGLELDSDSPLHAARAIDICKVAADENDWGLVSARWVMADGAQAVDDPDYALGHGLLSNFGANVAVRRGDRLLALSSGTARRPMDPGYVGAADPGFDKGYGGNHPDGFPKGAVSCIGVCPAGGDPRDAAALEVKLRVPVVAQGLSFDFKFYTSEYPTWICSQYNDLFVAILDPIPPGLPEGNIAFDALGNPVSVNSGFLEVCAPDPGAACYMCYGGTAELQGTGFEGHGATGWHTTMAPVDPGSLITLRFAIYDSGDGAFDSTVLIDNFRWLYRLWLPLVISGAGEF